MTHKRTTQRIAFWTLRLLGLLVVAILLWILGFIVYHGIGVINWEFLTTAPTDGMTGGGIFPAIVGTCCLIVGSMIVAFPLGSCQPSTRPNMPATARSSASSAS